MKPRFIFWTFGLVAAIVLSSCAPAVATSPVTPLDTALPTSTSAPSNVSATTAPEVTSVVPVQAVATSRGPNLEATDPASVSLASGQLQLIEFFRFT
jgi:hypothetical protein